MENGIICDDTNSSEIIEDQHTSHEQIEAWKKEHGKVFEVGIPDEDQPNVMHTAYYRRPKREAIEYIASLQKDPIKATKYLMNHCFLGGSHKLKGDTDLDYPYYQSACEVVTELMSVAKARVKKH